MFCRLQLAELDNVPNGPERVSRGENCADHQELSAILDIKRRHKKLLHLNLNLHEVGVNPEPDKYAADIGNSILKRRRIPPKAMNRVS